ncbi:MAG: hypothetical protein JRJ03_10815 [Deltaproteobacteria bacterium]|nr:hypothetical protein [Deltaproteobacteria bacterium]
MKWFEKLQKAFVAISFAEAGEFDTASSIMAGEALSRRPERLDSFLEAVGLKGVRVFYVVARV